MPNQDLIGYMAAIFTTSSFAPQAWQAYRSKNTSGVSLGMYCAFVLGSVLWLAYGLMLWAWPVILANGITLGLALFILALKLRYG